MDDGGWWTRRRRRTGVGRSRSLAHLAACPSAWTEMVNDRFLVPPQTQIRRRRRWMIGWRLACGLWGTSRFGLGLDWQWQWPGARAHDTLCDCDMKWYCLWLHDPFVNFTMQKEDSQLLSKFYYEKKRFPVTSKYRQRYRVLNVDEIKNLLHSFVVLGETNILNLISQSLDNFYQIKTKVATIRCDMHYSKLGHPTWELNTGTSLSLHVSSSSPLMAGDHCARVLANSVKFTCKYYICPS
jgi:hypothetical protein